MAWNLGSILVRFRLDTTQWTRSKRQVSTDIRTLGRQITALGATVTASVLAAVKDFGEFDKAIREATAVTAGLTDKEFQRMRTMAEDMSVALNKAATETAQGFYYLGSAGLSATEQMQSYNTVIKLSRALTESVGMTAEGFVDIMKGFNIEFSRSAEVGDILVKTITTSNQVFSDLRRGMAYVSGTAKQTNNDVAETAAALGIMANAGIKGSMAGVAFRRALTNLMSPTSKMRDLIYELGIDIYDATGRMRPFVDIFADLSAKVRNTSEEYQNMVFEVLFGRRAIAGMLKVFQLSAGELKRYVQELRNSAGEMDRITKWQMKAFLHQLGRVWQWVLRVGRAIGETLAPTLMVFGDALEARMPAVLDWIRANKDLVSTITKTTAAVGALSAVLGPLLYVLPNIARSMSFIAMATIKVGAPVLAVVAALYTIRAAAKQNIGDIGEMLRKLRERAGEVFEGMGGDFRIVLGWMAEDALKIVNRIIHGWVLLAGVVKRVFTSGVREFLEEVRGKGVPQYLESFFGLGDEGRQLVRDVKDNFHTVLEAVKTQLDADLESFGKWLQSKEWYRQLTNLWDIMGGGGRLRPPFGLQLRAPTSFQQPRFKRTMQELMLTMTEKFPNAFTAKWHTMTRKALEDFETMGGGIQDVFKDMKTGFEDAFRDLFELTGTAESKLKNLFNNLFNAVYMSMVNFVAKMMANSLIAAVFGGKGRERFGVNITPLTLGEFFKEWGRPVTVGGGGGGIAMPELGTPTLPTPRLDFQSASFKVAVNVRNEGPPVDMTVHPSFDGDTLVLNSVMRLAESDRRFRQLFVNEER